MLDSMSIGTRCSVLIDSDLYPAIYIHEENGIHLVYVNHLDYVMYVNMVEDQESIPLNEVCEPIEYQFLESPAYFRLGTTLGIKWGHNAYQVGNGKLFDVKPTIVVDKIKATISN